MSFPILSLLLTAITGLVLGYLIASMRAQKAIQTLSVTIARLETEHQSNKAHYEEQLASLDDARDSLAQHFAYVSQQALKQNNSLFLRLAEQSQKLQQARANAELEKRRQAIDDTIAPIHEALEKTRLQLKNIEQERVSSYSALMQQIATLSQSEMALQSETRNLIQALKRPDVRGRWGEMTLKRIVELAGMVEYCDFSEQVTSDEKNKLLRPDMVIRLPDRRELIIDAKAPLDAYLAAIDAATENQQKAELQRHARQLRDRMKSLASKDYWSQFSNSPDFVVLFIPGDQFLSSALAIDKQLMDDAMKNRIILATPSTLMALLRAVAFGWRQSVFSENAEHIRVLGEDLYHRISTLNEHFQRLGKSLNASVEHYNKTLGSLESQLIPGARKMVDLGIQAKKPLAETKPVEQAARPPSISE